MSPAGTSRSGGTPGLALVAADPRARGWLFALVVVLPLVLVGASALGEDAGTGTPWFAVGGAALFCLLAWAVLAALLQRHRLVLEEGCIEVATTFYRRRFALADLDLEAARVVDLGERPEYRPMLRTNGVGLPGFRSGWYRLRNGDKALVAAAGGQRLLWIPTRAGHDLLLQPEDPRAALERLRAIKKPKGNR